MEIKKEVKDLGSSNIQLDVTIDKQDAKEAYDKVIETYVKNAQIPGFRRGKVPASILEQRYGKSLKMEAGSNLIEKALTEIFDTDDKDIKPLGYEQPELIDDLDFEPDNDFTFSVSYDIFPKADLKKIDGFTIKAPVVTDEDAALENELKVIQRNNSFVVDKKDDETVQQGDLVTVDYAELDESGNPIAETERKEFAFEVGTKYNIYHLDDDIIGMKKGEEKDITKDFPEDYEVASLAGKKVTVRVKLTALKFRDMPKLDDDLAQDVNEKFKTLDDLKKDLTEKIKKAVDARIQQIKIDNYLDSVLEANDFALPESMVNADVNLRWANVARQMGISEAQLTAMMNKQQDGYNKERFAEAVKPESVKELKKRIVIESLLEAKPEITVTEADFEAEYNDIAESSNMQLKDVKEKYGSGEYKNYLTDIIKERKLFDLMLAACTVEDGEKIAASELLQQQVR